MSERKTLKIQRYTEGLGKLLVVPPAKEGVIFHFPSCLLFYPLNK